MTLRYADQPGKVEPLFTAKRRTRNPLLAIYLPLGGRDGDGLASVSDVFNFAGGV